MYTSFNSQAFSDGFPDWVGVAESPRAHEALTSLESAESSVDLFDLDIDLIDAHSPLPPAPMEIDELHWATFIGLFPPSEPSVFSTTSVETVLTPQSPVSDHTLVEASSTNDWFDKAVFDELQYNAIDNFEFTFTHPMPSVMYPDCLSSPPTFPLALVDQGYGQPTSQHEVCAATPSTDAHGLLGLGVAEHESLFSFSFTPPAAQEQPAAAALKTGEEPVQKRKRDASEEPTTKRRRRQSTTRRFPCPKCESVFARTHNLNVHIKSVHEGQRTNVCPEDDCSKSFSRKHDLTRHIQSKHTDLGSPRRKCQVEEDKEEY
ncbi:hypothetical protein C8Q80DRAFT_219180 [Daedaleopsis nitida]|nr:hypothetical protein C8Q80DRAFT_219180 [Daedaleopsis nitida]